MIDLSQFNNLISVVMYFSDKERCKQTIAESRWADGDVVCPYCGQHHCATRRAFPHISWLATSMCVRRPLGLC